MIARHTNTHPLQLMLISLETGDNSITQKKNAHTTTFLWFYNDKNEKSVLGKSHWTFNSIQFISFSRFDPEGI